MVNTDSVPKLEAKSLVAQSKNITIVVQKYKEEKEETFGFVSHNIETNDELKQKQPKHDYSNML